MSIIWKYLDKRSAAVDALKDYGSMKFIIGHTDDEIRSAYEKMEGVSSPQLDGMPHSHNPQASEDRIVKGIEEIDVLKERYRQAVEYMAWFVPAWEELTEDERYVLEAFYGEDNQYGSNAADDVADYFQIERASAYRRKNRALERLTILLFGKDEEGNLIIEPAEAEVVKRIYREYLEGASLLQIGRGLEADGILTGAGKAKWRPETLKKILQNEKYIGDALLQKTYTVDFLNKKRVQNKGIVPQYYVENSHEPIIPRDLYMQVQEEMIRRANLHSGANRKKRVYSSKYALSSIVYCSKCGEIYRRIAWNNRGKHSTVWRCCTRVEHGPTACDAPTIQESDLQAAVVQAINLALGNRESMMATLRKNVETVIWQEDETSSEGIEAKLLELQKELLKLANSKKDYNSVADEIDRLRELKQNALVESAEREGLKQRIREMQEFLEQQSTKVTGYDELLVRRLIEKVTVYDERFEVEFKSGAKVDVER